MDVSFGNENPFKDGIVATDTCKSPEIIDTEGKSKPLDFESFLTSVSDVNKISGKGSELNLPVTTTPCLDTIIGSVVGRIELHKFDSINNLTISSNLIENPSVASKNITEHSSSNYDFFYLEKIGSNESPVKEIEKNSSNSEFKEFASCGVDVCRRVDSSTAALLETDNVPSNDILREKKKENIEVQLNHKKIESEKLVDESNEMLTSCEVNNIELEKKSLEFQNNEEAGISIYTSVGQSLGRTNDIVNAHAIFDGQFQGSDDCVTGLSTDDRSDQTKICAIMPSKDSVNSMEIDKKLLESNSNKTPFSNLNNSVVKFEFGEEQVIESEINESKVKENSNESYCNLLTNGEKPKNQSECEVLKGIDNDIILSEKDTDVINSKDKCPSDENKLHSLSDMKASEVVLDRLKPHILKRPLLFSNLNPNEILQSDVEKDESLITDCEEKSQRKLKGNLTTKNIQSVIEEENLNSQETGNQVDIIEKHNSESKNEEHLGVEKNTNHSTNEEEEMLNSCSNSIKCSTSTQLNVDDSNEIFKKEQEVKTLSSDNIIKGLDENLLNQQKSCEKRNSSEEELVVETDMQCNRLQKPKRKLKGNLTTKNIQSVIEEENLNSQETGNQVDIIEKHNSESKNEEHLGVEKNTNHSTNEEEEMLNRCSNSIKCSTSTQLNVDDSNEIFKKEQEDKTLSSDNIIKGLDENLLNQQKSCEKRNSSEGELVVETDLQCNRLQKSKRKLKGNLTTENIQSVIEEENLNSQETGNQVDIIEKHNSKSKNEAHLGVEKNTNHSTNDEEEMLNRCSNSIKCSTSTQLNVDDSKEIFKKQQEDKTLSSDNIIKGLDEKTLNQQKSCEKKNSSEKLVLETDLQCPSESNNSSFESELFNCIDGNSSNCQIANSYNESDKKTRNSSLMIKPCIVVLEKLNSETLKMYSLDKYPSSNFISKCDSVFCSDKGEMLMDSCLSIFPENQEDNKIALKKIQNESSFKRKEKSHQKFNSSLKNEEVNFKSPKIVSSKISKGKKILTEFNKNTSGHVLDSSLIKEQKYAQEKVLKGTSKRDSTHLKNLKQAKRSGKLDEVTVIKRKKKWMHKSSTSMILNIEGNDINKNIEQKSKKVKYDKKEFNDLKVLYSIKECKIALEQLDSTILARYLNQVPQVFQSNQYNVDSNINACIGNKIVHIDRDGKGTVECQKHLLKKHGTKKISKECVQSTKLKKKLILKTNPLLNARSKRNSSSPFLKMNSSKPGIASYNSGEMEATGGTVLSCDSQDNSDLNFVPQVSVIDDNRVELDETNRLIKEQILMKRCNVKLEQCDSAILEKYLGNDWSKSLPQRVNLMDFEDSLPSNSASDVFSEFGDDSEFEDSLSSNSASDAFSDSGSSDQMDLGSDSDNRLSFEQELEFHDKKDHKDLICKSCNRKFKTYSSLLSHEKKTHETYPFKCVLCKQCFKKRSSFMNHMKRNHPEVEPYVCDYSKCEESFRTKKRLSDHKKSHQKYCCRFCKKRYEKKIFLQRHVSDCH